MKNRSWKALIVLALLVAISVTALPAPGTTQAQDNVTITFYRFFGGCSDEYAGVTDLTQANGECGIIQVLTNKFNAENEFGITVETQNIDWFTYYDQLSSTLAGGNPPDIAVMHRLSLFDYASRGLVMPLADGFAQVGIDVNDFTANALDAASYDGTIYAMPWDVHALLWHVNVDLMAEAGLVDDNGAPILPSSREELLQQAQLVKEKTGKRYMSMAGVDDPMVVRFFETAVWQQGSDVFDEQGTEAMFDTDAGREALDLLLAIYNNDYAAKDADYSVSEQDFLAGEAAIMINGTWVVDSYNAQAANPDTPLQNYVVRDFPTLYDVPATWSDSHMWVMPVQPDPDPAKQDASLKFLKFLYDNNLQWARTGHMPIRTSVLESPEYAALPHRSEYAQTALIARAVPPAPNQRGNMDIIAEELQSTWLTGKDPEAALADIDYRVNELLSGRRR
jgi:multiple sugar transport system substrate-binding protein